MQLINQIQQLPLVLLLILSGVGLILGDLFAKYWSQSRDPNYFLVAMVCYILYGLFFIPSLTKEGLVISALTVVLINIIGFVFIGLVIFKETLTPTQILGLIFGVVAVILLES